MGMDVYGRRNKEAYSRANVWSWRPIVDLMIQVGWDVPGAWSFNDGAGLTSEKKCHALADLLQKYLDENPDANRFEHSTDWEMKVNDAGVFGKGEGFTGNPYWTDRDHVQEWIKFLRVCGGFRIC
jgi:hypothetical protein